MAFVSVFVVVCVRPNRQLIAAKKTSESRLGLELRLCWDKLQVASETFDLREGKPLLAEIAISGFGQRSIDNSVTPPWELGAARTIR